MGGGQKPIADLSQPVASHREAGGYAYTKILLSVGSICCFHLLCEKHSKRWDLFAHRLKFASRRDFRRTLEFPRGPHVCAEPWTPARPPWRPTRPPGSQFP